MDKDKVECDDCGWIGTWATAHQRYYPGMVDCPECFGELTKIETKKEGE
jgi:hypothetical protein